MLEHSPKKKQNIGLSRTFDLEKGREKLELVILGRDRICELLAVVEGLQQGLEAVVDHRHFDGHRRYFIELLGLIGKVEPRSDV